MKIFKITKNTLKSSFKNNLFESASYVAYKALLALFPFLFFLVSIAGLLGQSPETVKLIEQFYTYVPQEVVKAIAPIVSSIIASPLKKILTFSIIGILWVSSSCIESIRGALNRAYEYTDSRNFFMLRLQSIGIVLLAVFSMIFISTLTFIFPFILRWSRTQIDFGDSLPSFSLYWVVNLFLSTIILSLIFNIFYRMLPYHGGKTYKAWPGALLAGLLWSLFAGLFSIYLENFGNYQALYGSLGGIIIALLFLQLSAFLILIGAQFNKEITR